MSKLVGFEGKSFTFEDGKSVNGFYIFVEEERKGVTGIATDRVFISDNKMNGYIPVLGDEVMISFNRWGKPQEIRLVGRGS